MARTEADKAEVGVLLREARRKSGLTVMQVQLGLLGRNRTFSEQSLRNWEKGRTMPPLTMLRDMAAVLGCDVEDLIPEVEAA